MACLGLQLAPRSPLCTLRSGWCRPIGELGITSAAGFAVVDSFRGYVVSMAGATVASS